MVDVFGGTKLSAAFAGILIESHLVESRGESRSLGVTTIINRQSKGDLPPKHRPDDDPAEGQGEREREGEEHSRAIVRQVDFTTKHMALLTRP